MKKILFASAIFLFSFQTTAFCQADGPVLSNAVSKLTAELNNHVTEKAYLHFDRPYACYVAGDTVYFKAYVTMSEKHELSGISGILHVDLMDKNDAIMKSIVLQLINGTAWGDFALSDTLHKGSYRVRAYTQYMRNTEHPYFFDQYLSVSSINNVDQVAAAARQSAQPSLQFFPEGGNLVVDVPSKVGFKALGTDGLGVGVKGIVVDNDNKEVARMASSHLGMGEFYLLPEAGKTYRARVTYADGSQAAIDLPAVEARGITLAVNTDDPAKVSIEIKANRDYFKANLNEELNILIYSGGDVRTVKTKLDNSILGLDLPASGFRTGILQVTLLSSTGEPLNERLSFVQNHDFLNLALSANKTIFAKRENVQLNLNVKNKDGNPANGFFSVAVIDENKIPADEDAENTISSYLLLKSELKGYIEQPNYYFAHDTKQCCADLDALMLTQGYRRFTWKQLLNNNPVAANAFDAEKALNISGVLKTKEGLPLANNNIFLIQAKGNAMVSQVTDTNGRFNFTNMAFYSGTRFILKTQVKATGKNGAVVILDKAITAPAPVPAKAIDIKYNTDADILASLQNNASPGVITASNEIVHIVKKDDIAGGTKGEGIRSSKLGGAGNADQILTAKDLYNSTTLSQGLTGVLHGVTFTGGVPYLQTSTVVSAGQVVAEPMLVVIDGQARNGSGGGTDGGDVDVISPDDVETVEVLKGANAGLYGIRGGNGVLIITTKQTKEVLDNNKEMAPGVFSISPKGFYKAREFYSPAYVAGQAGYNGPDLRTTIFWKPDVTTGADGNAVLNFYNADSTGSYRVVVEGMDDKGNIGRQVYRYMVK